MGKALAFVTAIVAVLMASMVVTGDEGWKDASATFYGDMSGGETMGGACGYGNLFDQGYGLDTAALSTAIFNDGLICGACYELRCYNNPEWCIPGATHVITATNFCPPNWAKPNDDGGWCNPPRQHFDMSMPAFLKIVKGIKVGIVPVNYRRVTCVKKGGLKFEIKGNPYWILVLVYNVAGAGDVHGMAVKGSGANWITMSRNWGQNWQTNAQLSGQGLSFRVTASDGKVVQLDNVVPSNWQFGQHFEGNGQF